MAHNLQNPAGSGWFSYLYLLKNLEELAKSSVLRLHGLQFQSRSSRKTDILASFSAPQEISRCDFSVFAIKTIRAQFRRFVGSNDVAWLTASLALKISHIVIFENPAALLALQLLGICCTTELTSTLRASHFNRLSTLGALICKPCLENRNLASVTIALTAFKIVLRSLAERVTLISDRPP